MRTFSAWCAVYSVAAVSHHAVNHRNMKLGFAHPVRQGNGLCHHVARILAPKQLDKLRYWFEGNYPPRIVAHEMDIAAEVRPNIDCVLITPTKIFEKMHLDFAVSCKVPHLSPI